MDVGYEYIMQATDIHSFLERLSSSNCRRCSLCEHDNRIVVGRGNPEADIVLVGEGPGAVEDRMGRAFVGPAGLLLDKIFASIGIDTNVNMFLSNINLCRPVAPIGSGKQNYTPKAEQRKQCIPYVSKMIELIKPRIVILAGLTAAKSLLEPSFCGSMSTMAGKFYQSNQEPLNNSETFVIYHPASIIHAQKSGTAALLEARKTMWNHIQILRDKLVEKGMLDGNQISAQI